MGCTASTSTKDQGMPTETKPSNGQQAAEKKSTQKIENQDGDKDHHDEEEVEFSNFQNFALYTHNHYREEHGSPPLKLNKELCALAEGLAKKMAETGQLDQSPPDSRLHQGEVCGENIFTREDNGLPVLGDEVVKYWYNEQEKYDYDNPENVTDASSFTQLIWTGSRELGIASETTEKGAFAVAIYFPQGNIKGQNQANVKPKTIKT